MPDLQLTMACVATDRSRPILDGRVRIPGIALEFLPGEPETIFRQALREQSFDISEMSMGSHLTVTARGEAHYIGIPIFPSRAFRHSAVFVRTDRGINALDDLKGRKIGLPEYQQTAALWMRGIMRDLHGVGLGDVAWRTGGQEEPNQEERIRIDIPAAIDLEAIGEGKTLNAMLADGELDAIITPRPPSCVNDPAIPAGRLFADYRAAEIAYFKQTGFFPIMHCIALRRSLAEQHPELPAALFKAFAEARDMAVAELAMVNVTRVTLPWASLALAKTRDVMGDDFWPFGFARNRDEVATMARYAFEDGLTKRLVEPEELFHPSTYSL